MSEVQGTDVEAVQAQSPLLTQLDAKLVELTQANTLPEGETNERTLGLNRRALLTIQKVGQELRLRLQEKLAEASGEELPWKDAQRFAKEIDRLPHTVKVTIREGAKKPAYQDTAKGTRPNYHTDL